MTAPARRHPPRPETGSVTVFVLLVCLCLAALLGLVSEGGLVLSSRETAVAEAEQAARAGAAALSPAAVRAGSISSSPPEAVEAAENVMAQPRGRARCRRPARPPA